MLLVRHVSVCLEKDETPSTLHLLGVETRRECLGAVYTRKESAFSRFSFQNTNKLTFAIASRGQVNRDIHPAPNIQCSLYLFPSSVSQQPDAKEINPPELPKKGSPLSSQPRSTHSEDKRFKEINTVGSGVGRSGMCRRRKSSEPQLYREEGICARLLLYSYGCAVGLGGGEEGEGEGLIIRNLVKSEESCERLWSGSMEGM